jgi:hypothetical protein
MRHLKVLGVALAAMFALSITALGTATSALALPDVSILPKETFPLDLHFADDGKTPGTLETSQGALLEGAGVEVLLLLQALGALGEFHSLFLGVVKHGTTEKCNTKGDNAGEVLITGEWHLVPISTTPSLVTGIAFLLTNLVLIECPKEKIDVKGCALAKTSLTTNNVDLTSTTGELGTDGKGKGLQREYVNDVSTKVKCILETEIVGTKIVREGAEGVNSGKPIELTIPATSLALMFELTGL